MSRAVFDNNLGITGIRGKLYDTLTIQVGDNVITLRGVYLRIDPHGMPCVVCKLPERDYSIVTPAQQTNREKFTAISRRVSEILRDPAQREMWETRFEDYKKRANITYIWNSAKPITLKGFIFHTLFNS